MEQSPPWPARFPNLLTHARLAQLQGAALEAGEKLDERGHSAAYDAAKAGDIEAAARVVESVLRPELVEAMGHRVAGSLVLPLHAEESTGRNKLPIAYAAAI